MPKGRESVQPAEEVETEVENPTTEEVETEAAVEDEGAADESPQETVMRAFNDLKSGKAQAEPDAIDLETPLEPAEGEEESEEPTGKINMAPTLTDATPPAAKAKGRAKVVDGEEIKDPTADDLDPDLHPVERMTPKAKRVFSNLPPTLKREVNKIVKDLESGSARVVTDANKKIAEVQAIKDAVAPYVDDWAAMKFSVADGIRSLAVAQKRLTEVNEEGEPTDNAVAVYLKMGRDLGISDDRIKQVTSGKPAHDPEIEKHPKVVALQTRLDALESRTQQQVNAQAAKPFVDDMNAARRAVDANGKPLYPELLNDAHLDSLKTRVFEIFRNEPGITAGQALLKANDEHFQKTYGYPRSSIKTRIPASPNQNTRITDSAVSVRGKTSSRGGGNGAGGIEPPPEVLDNPAATVKWVLEQQRRGNLL